MTGTIEEIERDGKPLWKGGRAFADVSSVHRGGGSEQAREAMALIGSAALVRFDPDALRQQSQLIPEQETIRFVDERGNGLPGVYQAIQGRGDEAFAKITASVRNLFPTVKNLRLVAVSPNHLTIGAELRDGTKVAAGQMSDGLLYFLALAAIPYIQPSDILLIEEPENGLHPARIRDVIGMLRAFSVETGTQILMATHSPLVVNELQPDEVSLVTRTMEEGTKVTPIRETPNFAKRSTVYSLGELWLSYADGNREEPLLTQSSG